MTYKKSESASILIVDDVHPLLIEMLGASGYSCDYFPDITKEEAINLLGSYEGLIIRSKFRLTKEVLAKAVKLKYIGRAGAGMDNIDVQAAAESGVTCYNAPEGNRDAVGEHTLGMMLSLTNHLAEANRQVKNMKWDRPGNRGIEIRNRTVGIIGYGFMGSSFASKLGSLGCRILAYDKSLKGFSENNVQESGLEELFAQADVLSIHIPLTSETKGWINYAFFEKFKKPILFLNTSRGEIVNTTDLVKALHAGIVSGAGLDVLENEKFPLDPGKSPWFNELVSMPQVLLSPHVAGWTTESYRRISEVLGNKILSFYDTINERPSLSEGN